MIQSMTGYGEGEVRTDKALCRIEARSVNHRFMDISIRLPRRFNPLEGRIRQEIQHRFSRGKFDITVSWQPIQGNNRELRIDLALARQFIQAMREIREEFQLEGPITVEALARFRDIFILEEREEDLEEVWDICQRALNQALDGLAEMRQAEGDHLAQDIRTRIGVISDHLSTIRAEFSKVVLGIRDRLRERIDRLFQDMALDQDRLMQEVVLLAERSDISEEIVRLESHLHQFNHALQEDGPLGRKLEFILQEINREANTISSKINDYRISRLVVDIKNEIEKLREQIQNIE